MLPFCNPPKAGKLEAKPPRLRLGSDVVHQLGGVDDHSVKKVGARVTRKEILLLTELVFLVRMRGACQRAFFWFGQPPPSLINKQNTRRVTGKTKSRPVEETDQGSIELDDHPKPLSLCLSRKQMGLSSQQEVDQGHHKKKKWVIIKNISKSEGMCCARRDARRVGWRGRTQGLQRRRQTNK
jgi:hypothetical protein